jgi:hypothetical protein
MKDQRVRIVATLGPASEKERVLLAMLRSGLDCVPRYGRVSIAGIPAHFNLCR